MEITRRQVLAATGAVGAGTLGLGYWQRRRLVRVSAILDLREIAGIEVPQIDDDPIITRPLLDASYDRAVDRFDDIERRLDPPLDRYSMEFVEDLRDDLTDRAPADVTVASQVPSHGAPAMHAARHQALAMYGIRRSRLVSILAHEAPGEVPSERFEERSTSVSERIESFAVPYRGATLGAAIVAGATIEGAVGRAESRLDRARREEDQPQRWNDLERATAASEDAESFVDARDGSDFEDALTRVADRLIDKFEGRRAEAPDARFQDGPNGDEPVPSFANNALVGLQRSMSLLRAAPWSRRSSPEDGEYGRAAHTHALLLPTVPIYEAFADVPLAHLWEDHEFALDATPADLREEKLAVIDAVEPYLDDSDPLVAHLAAVPLGVVRDADRRLRSLIEDANSLSDVEWARQRDRAFLQYESARTYVEAIDETIALVFEDTP